MHEWMGWAGLGWLGWLQRWAILQVLWSVMCLCFPTLGTHGHVALPIRPPRPQPTFTPAPNIPLLTLPLPHPPPRSNPWYRQHLATVHNNSQEVMLGYSDSGAELGGRLDAHP